MTEREQHIFFWLLRAAQRKDEDLKCGQIRAAVDVVQYVAADASFKISAKLVDTVNRLELLKVAGENGQGPPELAEGSLQAAPNGAMDS